MATDVMLAILFALVSFVVVDIMGDDASEFSDIHEGSLSCGSSNRVNMASSAQRYRSHTTGCAVLARSRSRFRLPQERDAIPKVSLLPSEGSTPYWTSCPPSRGSGGGEVRPELGIVDVQSEH